jgi:hypothetical protein
MNIFYCSQCNHYYHIDQFQKCKNAPPDSGHTFHNILIAGDQEKEWQKYDATLFDLIIQRQLIIVKDIEDKYIDMISCEMKIEPNGKLTVSNQMNVTTFKGQWIHPSLISP